MQEEKTILQYQKNEPSNTNNKIKKQDYYQESMDALVQYMKKHEQNPSEKRWNEYAICERYLSSQTIGYLNGIGFHTLCRKLRKEINQKKRQEEK